MKKATTRPPAQRRGRGAARTGGGVVRSNDDPSSRSLRELPEIVFDRFRARRNPYASRIAREGRHIVHDAPTPTSVREIPEAEFGEARVQRNPYASRAAEAGVAWQYGRGRPPRDREVGATSVRSLRLPAAAWQTLDREAKARRTTTHALLRELVGAFLQRLP